MTKKLTLGCGENLYARTWALPPHHVNDGEVPCRCTSREFTCICHRLAAEAEREDRVPCAVDALFQASFRG